MAHVTFGLEAEGPWAELDLVRSNGIARNLGAGAPARIDVLGPDGYISPDWYGVPDQVPTWNYVAISLTGRLEPMPPGSLEDLLARQSAFYEARLAPKAPWTMDKMTAETKARFLRMILPFHLRIEDMQSTWKLGQNKPAEVRMAASEALTGGFGSGLGTLSGLMRDA